MSTITVRAIAWGGKFIGTGQQGIAYLTVKDSSGNTIVNQQPINQGAPAGDDGSGVTDEIMNIPYDWGMPVNPDQAFSYQFNYSSPSPEQLTFTVQVFHYGNLAATASVQSTILPNVNMTGTQAVVITVPGLLTSVPVGPQKFVVNTPALMTANVFMMCGCMIDNNFWPGKNFTVTAMILDANGAVVSWANLTWSALATFTGNWTPKAVGNYFLQIYAVEITNGNTGVSPKYPITVLPPNA